MLNDYCTPLSLPTAHMLAFDDGNCTVEKVVDATHRKGLGRFYRVKWVRYLWQSEDSMQLYQHLIHEYWQKNGMSHEIVGKDLHLPETLVASLQNESQQIDDVIHSEIEVVSEPITLQCENETLGMLNNAFEQKDNQSEITNHKFDIPEEFNCEANDNDDDYSSEFEDHQQEVTVEEEWPPPKPKKARIPKKPKQFTCTVCDRVFTRHSSLKRHAVVHSGAKQWQCVHCLKTFNQKAILDRHIKTHGEQRAHQCNQCEKSFFENVALVRHKQAVHGNGDDKKWQCTVCGKEFALKEYLRKHEFLHTGDKPHKCDACGRAFADRSALRGHVKTHYKQHVCKKCCRTFPTPVKLKKHNCKMQL